MELVKIIYVVTKKFPKDELYGLTSQIRRSSVSVPSNIAEGSQRSSDKDFSYFIVIAKGSLAELETQIILAHNLGYIADEYFGKLIHDIDVLNRMLYSFYLKLIANS